MFLATHIYLLAALVFFALWLLLLLFTQRSLWKAMIQTSALTMVVGYFVEQMHLTDWWQPTFVFNGLITVEDTLFGFSIGGVIFALYAIFSRHLRIQPTFPFPLFSRTLIVTTILIFLFGLFYIFHVSSFWTSIISLCIPIVFVAIYARRFLLPMLLTGIAVTTIAFCGYQFGIYLNPHFVVETYLLSKLSGVLIVGIPIEELVWFFFASMGITALVTLVNPEATRRI